MPARPPADQYHAFTTRLAAAGYQNTTMRVVAGCILALALPALLAALAPDETPWPGFRLAYLAISAASVALATPWLRYRWPTRGESAAVVIVGTVALAGGCLATIEPMAGMVIASAFAFILGFTALFHSSRLLVFSSSVAALTVVWLTVRIAGSDIAAAVAVATPVVLLGFVVTFACRTIATVGASPEPNIELDPVTGLLTRDSFYERVATLLGARHRSDDRFLVVAVIDIDGLAAIAGLQGGRGTNQARIAVARSLRDTTRQEAVTGDLDAAGFVIADTFTVPDPSPLADRVRGAIAATPVGITASIGVVSTPLQPLVGRPPHEVLDEVIALAGAAMRDARAAGGNQIRYLLDPELGSVSG